MEENKTPAIVPMAADHLAAIAAIEARVSSHPWNQAQFVESLSVHTGYVLLDTQQVIGYAVLSVITPGTEGEAELLNIAVHSDYQGRSLAKQLLQFCLASLVGQAEKLFLEVRVSNFVAIHLYLAMGFQEVGKRRDYYSLASGGREDALLMVKSISEEAGVG